MSDKNNNLKEKTKKFAIQVRKVMKEMNVSIVNNSDMKQLIRSSGSVGANYIEACDSLSHKDMTYRLRICKKEATESVYWLNVIQVALHEQHKIYALAIEALEIQKIFGSIVYKVSQKSNINKQDSKN